MTRLKCCSSEWVNTLLQPHISYVCFAIVVFILVAMRSLVPMVTLVTVPPLLLRSPLSNGRQHYIMRMLSVAPDPTTSVNDCTGSLLCHTQ
ncbi:hypothetical protein XELAEV_18018593mg [Xenopus laevis]|uniref:Uncharacterized protein n=1 Tax=Xenopus laevis TaxID=8355 RepID=A0A974DDC6_XENLA|nr:hypothetical protein XELAEV_18018593mg [Xenopus laevis]